jgi:Ca2+-binding RTX toxin-like protein
MILNGTANDDNLTGTNESDIIVGLDGNDSIVGGSGSGNGNDYIDGDGGVNNGGNDTLIGGSGADTLVGGGGSDLFVFDTNPNNAEIDQIMDFNHNQEDKIILNKSVFAGLTGTNGNSLSSREFAMVNDNSEIDRNSAKIIYNSQTGQLFSNADGSGAQKAFEFAILDNKSFLTANSFNLG